MVQRTRGRGDEVPNAPALLDAMGHCRRMINDAQARVRPFGTAYHACAMVTTAIDALAHFITRRPDYYAVGGSVAPGGRPPDRHDESGPA